MGSRNVLITLAVVVVGIVAHADNSLTGTMLNDQVRPLISQEGAKAMEAARMSSLNSDSDKEVVWKDPSNDVSGAFKVIARFKNDQQQPCSDYVHLLRNREGKDIESVKTKKPLAFKNTVCLIDKQWQKYEGYRSNLTGDAGTADPMPEHRREYPNMVGPVALGQIRDGIKMFKAGIDKESTEDRKEQVRNQMYEWTAKLVEQMTSGKRTIAVDQLVILLGQVDTEGAKFAMVAKFKPRVVMIGDQAAKKAQSEKLLAMFTDRAKKSVVRTTLTQLPTPAPAAAAPATVASGS
jgi:hypothetical protein